MTKGTRGRLPIALDAMGGDRAPRAVIEASILACERGLGPIALIGDQEKINEITKGRLPEEIEVIDAPEWIAMTESPGRAARSKPNSSMHVGMRAVKSGEVAAFVTAGNSGAALAVGLMTLKRIKGCERPAIASIMPSRSGKIVLLDMGANVECRASHLAQFAVLGASYAQAVLDCPRPKVALLSNGAESNKGTETLREAHRLLNQMDLNYIGYQEAQALPHGQCDVLVTDGFVGNIALKLSEGILEALSLILRDHFRSKWWLKIFGRLLQGTLRTLKHDLDWRSIGGAPILGLKGIVIITHGKADLEAICTSIQRARTYSQIDLVSALKRSIESKPFSGAISTTSELPIVRGEKDET